MSTVPAEVEPDLRSVRFGEGSWTRFLARRVGRFIASLVVLVTVSFFMIRLVPGDPVRTALGIKASHSVVEQRRSALGLDQSVWHQYVNYWHGLVTGNLGDSFSLQIPVKDVLLDRAGPTLQLAVLSLILTMIVAIPLGLAAAAFTRGERRRTLDVAYTGTAGFVSVVPEFLIGVIFIYVFAVRTHWLPDATRSGPSSYILPVLALSIGNIAAISRIVRSEALGVLETDYIRTARSKRMKSSRLYLRHALPNLLTSSLTIGGLVLGSLVAGTVLIETIFAWPGLGATIVSSIRTKDFPVAQAIVIFYGALVLLINFIIDMVLVVIDPRSALKEI